MSPIKEIVNILYSNFAKLDTRLRNLEKTVYDSDVFKNLKNKESIFVGLVLDSYKDNFTIDVFIPTISLMVKAYPIFTSQEAFVPEDNSLVIVLKTDKNFYFYLNSVETGLSREDFDSKLSFISYDSEGNKIKNKVFFNNINNLYISVLNKIFKEITPFKYFDTRFIEGLKFSNYFIQYFFKPYNTFVNYFANKSSLIFNFDENGVVEFTPYLGKNKILDLKDPFKIGFLSYSVNTANGYFQVLGRYLTFILNSNFKSKTKNDVGLFYTDFLNKCGLEMRDKETFLYRTKSDSTSQNRLYFFRDNENEVGRIELVCNSADPEKSGLVINETEKIELFNSEQKLQLDKPNNKLTIQYDTMIIELDKSNNLIKIKNGNDLEIKMDEPNKLIHFKNSSLEIKMDSNTNKIDIKGDVKVDGTIESTQEVKVGAITLTQHKHIGNLGVSTSAPIP